MIIPIYKDLKDLSFYKPYMFDDEIVKIESLNSYIKLNKTNKKVCETCFLKGKCSYYAYSMPCRYDHNFVEVSEIELLILTGDNKNDRSK